MQEIQKFFWCHAWFVIMAIPLSVVLWECLIKTVWLRILGVIALLCLVSIIGLGFGSWGGRMDIKWSYGSPLINIIDSLHRSSCNNDMPTLQTQIQYLQTNIADSFTSISKLNELESVIKKMSSSSTMISVTNRVGNISE